MIQTIRKYAVLKDMIDRCDRVVRETLSKNTTREANIALESFNNGGKRLRPALLILSSMVPAGGAMGRIDPALIELAGAVELVHLATLFHDDVIDEVDTRRAKLSARLKYGNYASVLSGDYVLAEALEMVLHSKHPEAMPEFVRTLRVLIRGESAETSHKFNYDISEAQYYDVISEKSASLFALSCKVGSLATVGNHTDRLGHFGWNLGMAFQMIDDLDDMLDSPNSSHDCDLRNGYLSLPMIRVFSSLQDGHRERLIRVIEGADFGAENERYIVSLCMESGAIQSANEAIHKQLGGAADTLSRFPRGEACDLLSQVVSDLSSYADTQVDNYSSFLDRSTA